LAEAAHRSSVATLGISPRLRSGQAAADLRLRPGLGLALLGLGLRPLNASASTQGRLCGPGC